MKTIIIAVIILFSVNATEAADTTSTHKTPRIVPVRLLDENGNKIAPQDIWLIHQKDMDENGWRFDNIEYLKMIHGLLFIPPAFYVDPIHGGNGGVSIT